MTEILLLVAALSVNEFIHNIFELWGIDQKIDWLAKTMHGKKHGSWPINIDTKTKTIGLHLLLLLAITVAAYSAMSWLKLSDYTLAALSAVVLLANYVFVVWRTDRIHSRIGVLIRMAKKSKT